jgi:hypothetical protein
VRTPTLVTFESTDDDLAEMRIWLQENLKVMRLVQISETATILQFVVNHDDRNTWCGYQAQSVTSIVRPQGWMIESNYPKTQMMRMLGRWSVTRYGLTLHCVTVLSLRDNLMPSTFPTGTLRTLQKNQVSQNDLPTWRPRFAAWAA